MGNVCGRSRHENPSSSSIALREYRSAGTHDFNALEQRAGVSSFHRPGRQHNKQQVGRGQGFTSIISSAHDDDHRAVSGSSTVTVVAVAKDLCNIERCIREDEDQTQLMRSDVHPRPRGGVPPSKKSPKPTNSKLNKANLHLLDIHASVPMCPPIEEQAKKDLHAVEVEHNSLAVTHNDDDDDDDDDEEEDSNNKNNSNECDEHGDPPLVMSCRVSSSSSSFAHHATCGGAIDGDGSASLARLMDRPDAFGSCSSSVASGA